MSRLSVACAVAILIATGSAAPAVAQADIAARQRAVRQSIAAYPGSCPCPYSVDRGGRRCGGRSAYSRGGGYRPLCYPSDVRGGGRSRR